MKNQTLFLPFFLLGLLIASACNKPPKPYDLIVYFTHMRNEGSGLLKSIRESINIGKKANIPVQINHFLHCACG